MGNILQFVRSSLWKETVNTTSRSVSTQSPFILLRGIFSPSSQCDWNTSHQH